MSSPGSKAVRLDLSAPLKEASLASGVFKVCLSSQEKPHFTKGIKSSAKLARMDSCCKATDFGNLGQASTSCACV